MNKKSAIVTAGGLVTSFVAGVAAVSFNWGLGRSTTTQAAAAVPKKTVPVKPIIKHRTITVHKKSPAPAGAPAQAPRTVFVPPPAAASTTPPVTSTSGSHGAGGDDGHESGDGGGGDD
jgi:hypothetical protein